MQQLSSTTASCPLPLREALSDWLPTINKSLGKPEYINPIVGKKDGFVCRICTDVVNVKVNINGALKKQNEFICFIFQVKQRADECILALDKLTEINSGISVQNVLETHFDWSTLTVSFWLPLAVTCMHVMQCVVANTIMEMCHKTQKVVVTRAWGKLASVTRLQETQFVGVC